MTVLYSHAVRVSGAVNYHHALAEFPQHCIIYLGKGQNPV